MNQNRMESSDLVDIRTVTVDKSLPKEERIADFVRQISLQRSVSAVKR